MKCLFHRCRLFPFLTATGGGRRKKPHFTTTCHLLCEKFPSPPAPITRLLLACARLRPTWFFCCTPATPRDADVAGDYCQSVLRGGQPFFVLSGFVIATRYQSSVRFTCRWWRHYLWRRFTRIFPLYLLLNGALLFQLYWPCPPGQGTHTLLLVAPEPVAGPFQHAQVCRHSARMVTFSRGNVSIWPRPCCYGPGPDMPTVEQQASWRQL